MGKIYPSIGNAFISLEGLCKEAVNNGRVSDKQKERLDWELGIVEKQGSASAFLMYKELMEKAGLPKDKCCYRGTFSASVVGYALGLYDDDPLGEEGVTLYPEFIYGIEGEQEIDIAISVPSLYKKKMIELCQNKEISGIEDVAYKKMTGNIIFKVIILSVKADDATDEILKNSFEIEINNSDLMDGYGFFYGDPFDYIKPRSLVEYVKCYGLKHGTGAWEGNGKTLIDNGEISVKEIIACREDVFEHLLNYGLSKSFAYTISKDVYWGRVNRKGWKEEYLSELKRCSVPEWFIRSCEKIEYLFPRADALARIRTYRRDLIK